MSFEVIPAIDIQGGMAVRLRQGRAEDSTVFSNSPLEVARRFAAAGASRIHVVDLDGAFLGKPVNFEIIRRIAAAVASLWPSETATPLAWRRSTSASAPGSSGARVTRRT